MFLFVSVLLLLFSGGAPLSVCLSVSVTMWPIFLSSNLFVSLRFCPLV